MRALLIKVLPKNSFIYSIGSKVYNWYQNLWKPNAWQFDVLHAYANYRDCIKFIQIGSNNGVSGDPIHNYIKENRWEGILVEPVPYLFEELKNNYSDLHDKLYFENSAVANKNGSLKFYRLEKSNLPNLPKWYDQIGSFKKEVVLNHKDYIPFFDDLFIEDSVNAITFEDLLKKYAITKLDLIHIDTEGYDYEILKMIPFHKVNIDFIMFEHKNLSNSEYGKAIRLLRRKGYILGTEGENDTIAIKASILNVLTSTNKATKASLI